MSKENSYNIDHEGFAETFDELGLEQKAEAFRLLARAKKHIKRRELDEAEKLIDEARNIAERGGSDVGE